MPKNNESTLDEMAVIKRILLGHKEDYATLVRAHQQVVYAMIMRTVGHQDTAYELTQESFIRAYKSLGSFRGDASFATWITRIAINCTNSWFQSRSYKQQQGGISLDSVPEPIAVDEEIDPFSESNIERLRIGIGRLSEKYREVLVLCALEGNTYQEAADILGIPYGTACSRMNAALRALRTYFREAEQ